MIAIVDYGMGNLRSIEKALAKLNNDYIITNNHSKIHAADKLILPGVGNFGEGMKNINHLNLAKKIVEFSKTKPVLGICLGMQLLFKESEESAGQGLGLIDGTVKKFRTNLKIPHVGWNDVTVKGMNLFDDVPDGSNFYFVHSYHAELNELIPCCITNYDYDFTSAVQKGNVYGTQFHPEKSQIPGLKLLSNFIKC